MSRWLRGAAAVVVAGLIALAGAGQASAATLTVCPSGCTFSTIQAAIDAAGSGDSGVTGNTAVSGGRQRRRHQHGPHRDVNNSTVQCNSPDDIVGPFTEKNSKIGPPASC